MNSMVEVKYVDKYLDKFLKQVMYQKGIYEFKSICNKIINCEPVNGLDNYSKQILALAMEKRLMISIEKNRSSYQKSSYWLHLKNEAPLVNKRNSGLNNYLDLMVHDLYQSHPNKGIINEIKHFYDQEIYKASQLFTNKMFALPSGEKVSINDLRMAVNSALTDNNIINKLEYPITISKKRIKEIALISSLTTIIGISAIHNYKAIDSSEQKEISIDLEQQENDINEVFADEKMESRTIVSETIIESQPEVIETPKFVGYENANSIELQEFMHEMSNKYDVPFNIIMTIADIESNGLFSNNGVISSTNDYGEMQINICNHDAVYKEFGWTSSDILNDPYKNIEASVWLIKGICDRYRNEINNGNVEEVFGTYNGWINWKNKQIAVDYASKAMDKYNNVYNKTEEELYNNVSEVTNGRTK